jgi:cephalosporin hydroxylase
MFSGKYDLSQRVCTWNDPDFFQVITPQWPWEIAQLAALYERKKPDVTVEIGSFHGGTLRYWLALAKPKAWVIAIDPEPLFDVGVVPEGIYFQLCPTRSDDPKTIELCQERGIDFLFIDGDHHYDAVRYDFDTYGPMVRTGGIIAFHDIDTDNHLSQVPRLWREIQRAGYLTMELQCVHRPDLNLPGGGIGVVMV